MALCSAHNTCKAWLELTGTILHIAILQASRGPRTNALLQSMQSSAACELALLCHDHEALAARYMMHEH